MCGRLNTHGIRWLDLQLQPPPEELVRPSYNLAPGGEFFILVEVSSGGREVFGAEWGLQYRRRDGTLKRLHNARCETVRQIHVFREAFLKSRCVVPAHGFYEWSAEDRQPFYFCRKDGHPLTLAGIFEKDSSGKMFVAILTMQANQEVRKIHHRMPVVLDLDKLDLWLKKAPLAVTETSPLFDANMTPTLNFWPVPKSVGNTRNDHPGLILEVQPQTQAARQPTIQEMLFTDLN